MYGGRTDVHAHLYNSKMSRALRKCRLHYAAMNNKWMNLQYPLKQSDPRSTNRTNYSNSIQIARESRSDISYLTGL